DPILFNFSLPIDAPILNLFYYDTTILAWIPAASSCLPPHFLNELEDLGDHMLMSINVCHLTRFGLLQSAPITTGSTGSTGTTGTKGSTRTTGSTGSTETTGSTGTTGTTGSTGSTGSTTQSITDSTTSNELEDKQSDNSSHKGWLLPVAILVPTMVLVFVLVI